MKKQNTIGIRDLLEGFLFSLRAEGRAESTIDYYSYLLHPLISYALEKDWSDDLMSLDPTKLREVLNWTRTRTQELRVANKRGKAIRKAKHSTAWPYFRAMRRLFNWAVEEGYLPSSPLAKIHFKPPPEPQIEGYPRMNCSDSWQYATWTWELVLALLVLEIKPCSYYLLIQDYVKRN
ncbi:hypothetical protein ACFLTP_04055 [Chloroflexota bacterium]